MRAVVLSLVVLLFSGAAGAQDLRLEGQLIQGGLIQGATEPGAEVLVDGRAVRVSDYGHFLIGFGRDDTGPVALEVRHPNGVITRSSLAIEAREYDIQRIDGLPQNMVSPDPDTVARIQREGAVIAAARAHDTAEPLFAGGFLWPAIGPISGVYGSQRILNGEPRQPHFGIDVANPTGSPVTAPADGIVVLAEDDLFYTGGTVMLDHGHGLTTAFLHMSAITVSLGQRVDQGDLIGRIGATGRVTGAHLDWRVNLFKARLDPQLLVGPMPDSQ